MKITRRNTKERNIEKERNANTAMVLKENITKIYSSQVAV